jgi:hypothetical protein
LLWSVEREKGHTYKDTHEIINEKAIHAAMESTQKASRDKVAIKAILDAAKERSFLTNYTPGAVRTLAENSLIVASDSVGQLLLLECIACTEHLQGRAR